MHAMLRCHTKYILWWNCKGGCEFYTCCKIIMIPVGPLGILYRVRRAVAMVMRESIAVLWLKLQENDDYKPQAEIILRAQRTPGHQELSALTISDQWVTSLDINALNHRQFYFGFHSLYLQTHGVIAADISWLSQILVFPGCLDDSEVL